MRTTPLPTPAEIGASCNLFAVRRAARALARRYDDAFAAIELNNGQFSMLAAIAGPQPVGIGTLAERLGMDRTTVTAALKPLVRRGLLAIAVAQDDLRGRNICLTAAGAAKLKQAIPIWQKAQRAVAIDLGGNKASRLLRNRLARIG